MPARTARRRLRLPALRRLQAHDRARQRRLRAEGAQAAPRTRSGRGSTSCSSSCSSRASPTATRRSSPAASASAWRSPARWRVEPRVLLLDEPFGALDAQVREELRVWLRRLHDEVHVTTVFVTHDQEEAMEVAEQVVVINEGRDRAGRARRATSTSTRPTSSSWASSGRSPGSATRSCARTTSRSLERAGPAPREALVERVVHLGFEVRVELTLDDGARRLGPAHAGAGRRARAAPRARSSGSARRQAAPAARSAGA